MMHRGLLYDGHGAFTLTEPILAVKERRGDRSFQE